MPKFDDIVAQTYDWVTTNFPLAQQRKIGPRDSLLETGIIDSLGTLDLVEFLESEFDIEVADEDMLADHFESVEAIARYVDSRREPAGDGGQPSEP